MNFLDAVKTMKEGRSVKRKKTWMLNAELAPKIMRWGVDTDYVDNITIEDIEATDWEVVDDDKDWNLMQNYIDNAPMVHTYEVKKCRDLILKDFKKVFLSIDEESSREEFENIVKERFGNL